MTTPGDYGMTTPTGSDLIRHGDDAITNNAQKTAAALGELTAKTALIDRGVASSSAGSYTNLAPGRWQIVSGASALALGLPASRVGVLEITPEALGGGRVATFTPNDASVGPTVRHVWTTGTNSQGEWTDRWWLTEQVRLRTAPVVLNQPAIDSTQSAPRPAWRLPFSVPAVCYRWRVHMTAKHYRTGHTWGPVSLVGVGIGTGTNQAVTGITAAPGAAGATIPHGGTWTSEWISQTLYPGTDYMLAYGADFSASTAPAGLLSGTCWASEAVENWNLEGPVGHPTFGGLFLSPLDVWIEVEAPANVPVFAYYGSSNEMGMNSPGSVRDSYPQIHARRNGAFCAQIAAGGRAIVDATFQDEAIQSRFGAAGRADRAYAQLGANLEPRNATLNEAKAAITSWLDRVPSRIGNPTLYLVTQPGGALTEQGDSAATRTAALNDWIRYDVPQRPDVAGIIDLAAIFNDPAKPWRSRPGVLAGPTDNHYSLGGQRLRALALDGELLLPQWGGSDVMLPSATTQVPLAALWGDTAALTLTRSGDTVTLSARDLLGPVGHTGAIDLAEIPLGFRPTLNLYGVTWRGKRYNTSSSRTLRISETPSGPMDYLSVTYITTDPKPWPT